MTTRLHAASGHARAVHARRLLALLIPATIGVATTLWANTTRGPATTASPTSCVGDCDESGSVAVEEIVTTVAIALDDGSTLPCSAGDANADGRITVDEIIRAVDRAVNGCGDAPCDPAAGMADCQTDAECIVIQDFDCCSCAMGGQQGAINRANLLELSLRRAACCRVGHDICIALYNCNDTLTARCEAGTCQVVWPPTRTPPPSPTPTPDPIAARHCDDWDDCADPLRCIPEGGGICFGGPVCAVFLVVSAHTARAGTTVWTSHGPYGGYVYALAIDPLTPSRLYAGTGGGSGFDIEQVSAASPTPTVTPSPTLTPTGRPACSGDCDGDAAVAVDEIITLVNIALGRAPPSACPAGIPPGTAVDVGLIIQAVNHAQSGCGGS